MDGLLRAPWLEGCFWSEVMLCEAYAARFGEVCEVQISEDEGGIVKDAAKKILSILRLSSRMQRKRSCRHPDMSLSAYDPVDRRKNVRKPGNPIPSPVIFPAALNATWRHGGFCLMVLAGGEISGSVISYLERVGW